VTEGEWRVGVSFNPSNNEWVDKVKFLTAELIDLILLKGTDLRTMALAATHFEDGAMWAVKSITKSPK
jgi:hypothetical protein